MNREFFFKKKEAKDCRREQVSQIKQTYYKCLGWQKMRMVSYGKLDKIALQRARKWLKIKYIPRVSGGDSKAPHKIRKTYGYSPCERG